MAHVIVPCDNQPPGGGVMLVQMLNILENFDLAGTGHNTPEYLRIVCEAGVQNGIRNLVADLVGVAFRDRLRGEEITGITQGVLLFSVNFLAARNRDQIGGMKGATLPLSTYSTQAFPRMQEKTPQSAD